MRAHAESKFYGLSEVKRLASTVRPRTPVCQVWSQTY